MGPLSISTSGYSKLAAHYYLYLNKPGALHNQPSSCPSIPEPVNVWNCLPAHQRPSICVSENLESALQTILSLLLACGLVARERTQAGRLGLLIMFLLISQVLASLLPCCGFAAIIRYLPLVRY